MERVRNPTARRVYFQDDPESNPIPWYRRMAEDTKREARRGPAAAISIRRAEASLRNAKARAVGNLTAMLTVLDERLDEDREAAVHIQCADVLDELIADTEAEHELGIDCLEESDEWGTRRASEGGGDKTSPPNPEARKTLEGGGATSQEAPPPQSERQRSEAAVSRLLAISGVDPNTLKEQVTNLLQDVQTWPEEVAEPRPKRMIPLIKAQNEQVSSHKVELCNLLDARHAAQQPDILTAQPGQQNDDGRPHKCLLLKASLRPYQNPAEEAPSHSWKASILALIDSGASRDFINEDVVKKLGLEMEPAKHALKVQVADGRELSIKHVVWIDLCLNGKLGYRTRAYVMPMGKACDVILGMSFFETLGPCEFDGVNRTLAVDRQGERIVLEGQGVEEAKVRAKANALLQQRTGGLEIISPEEGARDMQTLKQLERRLRNPGRGPREHLNVLTKEYLEPFALHMRMRDEAPEPEEVEWQGMAQRLQARATSEGVFRGVVAGISDTLLQRDHWAAFRVDATANPPMVHLIQAEERDFLYPFGERAEGNKTTEELERSKARTLESAGHKQLVEDILSGRLQTGAEVDVERYQLHDLVTLAKGKLAASQKLVALLEGLVKENTTLGETFWTEELRAKLTDQLATEYDTVIRQELRFTDKLNEHLEPAPIRLHDEWDGRAPYERSRRMSPQELAVVREQLAELLELGMIQPSASPFGAAVMVIPKPGQPGKFRMVIDYRRLNSLTVPDKYPLPDIGELLDDIGSKGYRYWCTFDLCSGFYNVPILPEHVERTAMSTPLGNYQWRVMPMGLRNAPSIFQRNMQRVFSDMPQVRIFVDDGIIGGATVEELYVNLRKVLKRLKDTNMVMKKSKLQFFKEELKFLGHVISRDGVSPQLEKVEAVKSWPRPKTKKDLRGYLGLVGYYTAFIYNAAHIMRPLHDLTKDDATVPSTDAEWEAAPAALQAFEELKARLCSAPVLALPDYKAAMSGRSPFLVQTDASEAAMGAVLMQDQGKGWQPICFASKAFSPAEINYSVTEKELLALVWATTEKFRHYILGTTYEIQGDHKALVTLMHPGRAYNRRQARWVEILQEQNVPQMTYVKGATLTVPDALSRRPDYMEAIPTALQGLRAGTTEDADLLKDLELGDTLHTDDAREAYFTDKQRPHSMPGLEVRLPPLLTDAPKAISTKKLQNSVTVEPDPTLPTGVMPHGKVQAALELCSGGAGVEHVLINDCNADVCRTIVELACGILAPTLGPQPLLPAQKHRATAWTVGARDNQDWQMDPVEFRRWDRFYGFTVDACADAQGKNAQLRRYWADCLTQDWRGEVVWCNPPFNQKEGLQVSEVLKKFMRAREADPSTAACFILPHFAGAEWEQTLTDMRDVECVYTYPTGTPLFYAEDGGRPPTKWPVQVWWCPPRATTEMALPVTTRSRTQATRTASPLRRTPTASPARPNTSAPPAVPRESTGHPTATETATRPRLTDFLRQLKTAQQGDPSCVKWTKETQHTPKEFRTAGDMLWRVADGRYQLVIPANPPELRNLAMHECHDAAMAGHFGKHKTLATVRQRFWWPHMAEDVAEYCRTCPTCQRIKVSRQRPAVSLHQAELPIRRWQEISVDFVTGLAATARGFDAIMTVTDRASKMVHLIPLLFKGSDALKTARLFIDHVWRLHGMPQKIFSDRDPRFTSAFWKELTRLTGMMSGMTTAWHPQGNGAAERTNQTMEQVLRAYVSELGTDWDLHLSAAEYAINNTPSRSTGEKPFVLMYGESPSTQLDLFVRQMMDSERVSAGHSPKAKRFVIEWQRLLTNAKNKLEAAQRQQMADYARHKSRPHQYVVGQKVMLSTKAVTSPGDRGTKWKLRGMFYGPLEVIGRRLDAAGNPSAYQLQLPFQWKVHNWFSEDKLKPYLASNTQKWPHRIEDPPPPTELVDGREEYVVDKIVGHRVQKTTRGAPHMQWLVRWRGYGPVYDEWRSVEDINTGGMELEAWRDYERERLMPREGAAALVQAVREALPSKSSDMHRHISEYWESTAAVSTPWRDSRKPFRILVLFSGTGSVERAVNDCYPQSIAVSIDSNPAFRSTHCCTVRQWMEMEGGMEYYQPGYFDIIWASPPCTEYSRAKTTGKPVRFPLMAAQPHRNLQEADDNVRAAREVIDYLKPKYWFIENPVGLLATRRVMADLHEYRHTCTYCRYGMPYQKRTHIWTNAVLRHPLKCCTTATPCEDMQRLGRHTVTAQSGDSHHAKGSGSGEAVYPIPAGLIHDLMDIDISRMHSSTVDGGIALSMIASIWEGELDPTTEGAKFDFYGQLQDLPIE